MTCSGRKVGIAISVTLLVIAVIVIVGISIRTIEVHEVGVVYDTAGYKLDTDVKGGGLYTVPPGSQIITFPNVFKVMSFDITCINLDGVEVTLDVTYQFRAQESKVVQLVKIYKDYDNYEELLRLVGKSAILAACNEFNTYEVIARRENFTANCKSKVAEAYQKVGSDVSGLQVDNIARPSSYDAALRAKEAARESSVVKLNERKTKIVEAETKLSEEIANAEISRRQAESDARLTISKAEAEAEAIKKWYEVEAGIYKQLLALGFTGQSLLTYLEVDTIANAQQPVFVGLDSPVNLTLT